MFPKLAARRRHQQIMAAACYMVDAPALLMDSTTRIDPELVIALAYGRHQLRITADEAREALAAALVERGFGLDRITAAD